MSPGPKKRALKRNGAFIRVGVFRKHARLMGLLFCFSLLCGVVYYLYTQTVYSSRALVEVNGITIPADEKLISREAGITAAIKDLQSPHLVERAARRFGLKASARDIQLKYGLKTEITSPADAALHIDTWTISRDLARLWAQSLVEEYAAYRAEKHQRDREEIFDAYARELKDAAARTGQSLDENLRIRSEADALRVAGELQMGTGSSAEIVRLTKLIDAMGRVRIQLEDRSLDAAAKLALIAKVQPNPDAAATPPLNPTEGEYQAAKKRFELDYQHALDQRSELETKVDDDSSAGKPGAQGRPGSLLAQKSRPNWERMAAELQKKLGALEERRAKEGVDLAFVSLLENRSLPIWPSVEMLALFAVGMGLLLAFSVPLVIEAANRARHNLGEVESTFQLRGLGSVPLVDAGLQSGLDARNGFEDARMTESFRLIRANLLAAAANTKAPHVTMITSAMPKEGKTLIAANLALSFARDGERTLLIDADLQRGRVHRLFGYRQSPGLSDALFGEVTADQACRATNHQNLSILTVGKHFESAAELIGSEKLADLVATLRGRFDRIVLDAPPVLGLAEAGILQKHVDGVVFVVWSGQTAARNVKAAIEVLQESEANFYGLIVNRPDLEITETDAASAAASGSYQPAPVERS